MLGRWRCRDGPPLCRYLVPGVGLLQVRFPELADALSRAYAIVAAGNVFPEESGREAMVLASDGVSFYHVNGSCTCKASTYRADVCKHRLALRLYQRVADAMLAEEERWEPDDANPAFQPPAAAPAIPAEHLVQIQGKPFVKFAGLLQLAHQRGLQALRADWTYNVPRSRSPMLAVFPFGTFEERGCHGGQLQQNRGGPLSPRRPDQSEGTGAPRCPGPRRRGGRRAGRGATPS